MKLRNSFLTINAILFSALLGACAGSGASQNDYAKQTEAALERQMAEPELVAPSSQKLHLDLIRKLQDRSMYFASLAHFESYEKLYGTTPEVLRLHADSLRATGQPTVAEKRYQQLLNSTEASAAWRGLGLLAAQRDDYGTAATMLQTAVQNDPTNATALSDLGYALMRSQKIPDARLPLLQAAELEPENKKVISNVALYLMLSNDIPKAEALMARAQLPTDIRAEILRQRNLIAINEEPITLSQMNTPAADGTSSNTGLRMEMKLRALPSKLR